ncbi:cobalt ECF transporter T component CbiQ [Metabacillus sp. HB246100]
MLQIDQYAHISPLKHIHPVEKVSFSGLFLLFSILTKDVWVTSFTFIVMSVIIVAGGRIHIIHYVKLLTIPSLFLLTSLVTILFSIAPEEKLPVETLWSTNFFSWKLYISRFSFHQTFQLAATVLSSVSCLYFFILSTPLHQFMWVLQKAKLPKLFRELLGFTYQFIFVLFATMQEIYVAQASRLGYQHFKGSIGAIAQLVANLFIKSLTTAKELQIAIDSRGGDEFLYDIDIHQSYRTLHIAGIGISAILLTLLTVCL